MRTPQIRLFVGLNDIPETIGPYFTSADFLVLRRLTHNVTDDPHDLLREDPHLGPLVEEHGRLIIEPADDFFARFITSILRQQVSMESAAATRDRLFDRVNVTPEGILAADPQTLQDCGLSRQKTRYVRNVAKAFSDGLSREALTELSDAEIRAKLTAITGVGEWTANMQLLFALGREDVFPVGDLGIRKGMHRLFGMDLEARGEMVEMAKRWAPYRSYASLYLWRVEEAVEQSVDEVRRS